MQLFDRIAALGLIAGMGAQALGALPGPSGAGEKASLDAGECVLVTQVRDLLANRAIWSNETQDVAVGSGGALVQAVHNVLMELGLVALTGSYASKANALEQAEKMGCDYVVRPELEQWSMRRRPKIGIALELLATGSGGLLANCSERREGTGRSRDLLRPAVRQCLSRIVEIPSGSTAKVRTGGEKGRLVVMPHTESWVFQPDDASTDEQLAVRLTLDLLDERDFESMEASKAENPKELLARARKDQCNWMLRVGTGVLRTTVETPSREGDLEIFADLVDVTSGQALMSVVARDPETDSSEPTAKRLRPLLDRALHKLLGRSPLQPADSAPGRVSLSVLEPPTVIEMERAEYPKSARRKCIDGDVKVGFIVGEDGLASDVRVIDSIPELDESVVRAVKRSRYAPGRLDGEVAPIYMVRLEHFEREKSVQCRR